MVSGYLILALVVVFVWYRYSSWKSGLLGSLNEGIIASTRLGDIEYKLAGEGPTVLILQYSPHPGPATLEPLIPTTHTRTRQTSASR